MNKRPARLTHLGKIRASRRTKRVRAKIRDGMKKSVHPVSRKPKKAAWAKKGYPYGLKTQKGGPGKS